MAKKDKRLQKARNNPKHVSYDDLRGILEDHDFELEHGAGSKIKQVKHMPMMDGAYESLEEYLHNASNK